MILIYSIASASGLGLASFLFYYNRLAKSRIACDEAYSTINVQLQKRWDLIPKIEEITDEASQHEVDLLRSLGELKAKAKQTGDVPGRAAAENEISNIIRSIFKGKDKESGNSQFSELREAVVKIEKEVEMATRYYNALVREYNTKCEVLPSAIVATLLRFRKKQYYEQ